MIKMKKCTMADLGLAGVALGAVLAGALLALPEHLLGTVVGAVQLRLGAARLASDRHLLDLTTYKV